MNSRLVEGSLDARFGPTEEKRLLKMLEISLQSLVGTLLSRGMIKEMHLKSLLLLFINTSPGVLHIG